MLPETIAKGAPRLGVEASQRFKSNGLARPELQHGLVRHAQAPGIQKVADALHLPASRFGRSLGTFQLFSHQPCKEAHELQIALLQGWIGTAADAAQRPVERPIRQHYRNTDVGADVGLSGDFEVPDALFLLGIFDNAG